MGGGWERFEFNKDAPLDDEEIEGEQFMSITFPFEYLLGDKFWSCRSLLLLAC
jgi:hypothetical protein